MKRKMSISTQSFLGSIVIGLLWIVVGIVRIFDNPFLEIIHIILLALVLTVMFIVIKANREEDDEMSHYNDLKAKAKTRDIMQFVYGGSAIISAVVFGLLQNQEISWVRIIISIFFILMGIQDIITGIVFHSLEAE